MKDKICAMIRQTWYETAKHNLTAADRLRFYEICLEYEFYGNLPDEDAPFAARLLFDMVRADIDADKERANARAERARHNGMFGGRPRVAVNVTEVNKTEDNPVGYSETDTKPIYNNNIQYNTVQNKKSERENEDTHTLFSIALLFFEKGCAAPVPEAEKFWNYYAAMGWKTKGGGEIVDRFALARAWKLPDCSRALMRRRAPYADLMHKAHPTELCLLSDYVEMVRDADAQTVCLTFTDQATCMLLDHRYMPALKSWIPVKDDGSPFELSYKALQTSL